MTKTELQVALAAATETNKKTAGVFLDTLSELAYKTTKKTGEFVLPGFGKLVKQKRKARRGFNPKTQQKIRIPAKTVVKFRVDGRRSASCVLARLSRIHSVRSTGYWGEDTKVLKCPVREGPAAFGGSAIRARGDLKVTRTRRSDPQAQAPAQPLTGTTAEGVSDQLNYFTEALGFARMLVAHTIQALTEDLSLTARVATTPTAHLQS
jgi:DNA-binding protein HU-beta